MLRVLLSPAFILLAQELDVCADPRLLIGEELPGDLVPVVELQELPAPLRLVRTPGCGARSGGPPAGPATPLAGTELPAIRPPELQVVADESQSEHRRTVQPFVVRRDDRFVHAGIPGSTS